MEKIDFVNNDIPALNARNLNKLQDNIEDALEDAGAITVQTEETTSDTDTYSCTYINTQFGNKLNTSAVKTSNTTSDNDTYSCNFINTIQNNLDAISKGFHDTTGTSWRAMMKNKIDYCISNITLPTNGEAFINGGWQGSNFGFGLFSKIGTTYQLIWFSNRDSYVAAKTGSSYSYKIVGGTDYSTSEKETGTWANGKPVYCRVIEETMNLSTAGAHESTTKISNFGQLVKMDIVINGYYAVAFNNAISAYGVRVDNGAMYLYTNVNWDSALPLKFIVEYTKSTD